MKKAFLIVFLLGALKSYSQDTTFYKAFTISTNLIQAPINELSLYGDWRISKHSGIGISVGHIYSNNHLEYFPFLDENNIPGLIYRGLVSRINFKYYLSHYPNQYVAVQFSFRYIAYSNQGISENLNPESDAYEDSYNFTRSEKTDVYGLDVFWGSNINKLSSCFLAEVYFGFGVKDRIRHITDSNAYYLIYDGYEPSNKNPAINPYPPKTNQVYPALILGFKIGFGFKKTSFINTF